MKVVTYCICDSIESNQKGENVLVNPLQMLMIPFLPTNYSFVFSFGLFDIPKDGFQMKIQLINPKGKEINTIDLNIPKIPEDKEVFRELPFGLQLNISFNNMVFDMEGEYTIKLNYDDDCVNCPLEVVKNERINKA